MSYCQIYNIIRKGDDRERDVHCQGPTSSALIGYIRITAKYNMMNVLSLFISMNNIIINNKTTTSLLLYWMDGWLNCYIRAELVMVVVALASI